MPLIPPPSASDYPTLPELTPIQCSIEEIKRVPNTKFPQKDGTIKDQYQIVLCPLDVDAYGDARIWHYAGVSWHEKSKLVPLTQACFDHQLSQDELYQIDPEVDLLKKHVVVIGSEVTDQGYLKKLSFRRIPKAQVAEGGVVEAALAAGATVKRQDTVIPAGGGSPVAAEVIDPDDIPFLMPEPKINPNS